VEPTEVDPGQDRRIFYERKINPELSIPWLTYNLGKRVITPNLEITEGRIFQEIDLKGSVLR
jgi:hypothetical protein